MDHPRCTVDKMLLLAVSVFHTPNPLIFLVSLIRGLFVLSVYFALFVLFAYHNTLAVRLIATPYTVSRNKSQV